MANRETGVIEVQQWQHFRRPAVRTSSGGVYLLDHPCWLSQAGRRVVVRYHLGDQFASVEELLEDAVAPGTAGLTESGSTPSYARRSLGTAQHAKPPDTNRDESTNQPGPRPAAGPAELPAGIP